MERIITRSEAFDQKQINLHESLFFTANGYIGVRGTLEEGVPEGWNTMRGMYLNGVYEIIPMKQAESLCNLVEKKQTMLNVADTQTIFLTIDGERFSLGSGELVKNERILNMSEGYAERQIVWRSPAGKEAEITIRRTALFNHVNLFLIDYQVKPLNFSGEIEFESWHIADVKNYSNPNDPRLAAESEAYLHVSRMEYVEDTSVSLSTTGVSGISVAAAAAHAFSVEAKSAAPADKKVLKGEEGVVSRGVITYKANAAEGQTVRLTKYTALTDSIRFEDPAAEALKLANDAKELYLGKLYEEQAAYLDDFWNQSEMTIEGDDDLNAAVSFNMYALLQSASRDRHSSIAAKGLSGEGYEGHYFWDTEMYMAPFFTLTNPELAKMLLNYRYTTLPQARENAKLLGHKKGALYPWRTITGVECSGYFPSGTAAYHINGAITYAIIQYYLTTGDTEFILETGEEMLLESARLWFDVGNYSDGKFVIHEVTGPDEYTCMVDNNYYTNCCAKYNMHWAVKLAKELADEPKMQALLEKLGVTADELAEIDAASEAMFLPYDEKLGINPQDDSFTSKPVWDIAATPKEEFPLLLHYHPLKLYRYQVCKQADTILAYFLFEKYQAKDVMERSFRYYEKITTHDSSLSTCVFSLVGSRLGLKDEAFKYFGDSAKLDLMNLHGNSADGIHTANMGGCYMAVVNGFAGIRIDENGISIDPAVPDAWEGYSFKIRYQDRLLRLSVRKAEDGTVKSALEVVEGESLVFIGRGKECAVESGEAVEF